MNHRGYMPPAQRSNWQTPPEIFDSLMLEFGQFDLDPCGDVGSYVSGCCRHAPNRWTGRAVVREGVCESTVWTSPKVVGSEVSP